MNDQTNHHEPHRERHAGHASPHDPARSDPAASVPQPIENDRVLQWLRNVGETGRLDVGESHTSDSINGDGDGDGDGAAEHHPSDHVIILRLDTLHLRIDEPTSSDPHVEPSDRHHTTDAGSGQWARQTVSPLPFTVSGTVEVSMHASAAIVLCRHDRSGNRFHIHLAWTIDAAKTAGGIGLVGTDIDAEELQSAVAAATAAPGWLDGIDTRCCPLQPQESILALQVDKRPYDALTRDLSDDTGVDGSSAPLYLVAIARSSASRDVAKDVFARRDEHSEHQSTEHLSSRLAEQLESAIGRAAGHPERRGNEPPATGEPSDAELVERSLLDALFETTGDHGCALIIEAIPIHRLSAPGDVLRLETRSGDLGYTVEHRPRPIEVPAAQTMSPSERNRSDRPEASRVRSTRTLLLSAAAVWMALVGLTVLYVMRQPTAAPGDAGGLPPVTELAFTQFEFVPGTTLRHAVPDPAVAAKFTLLVESNTPVWIRLVLIDQIGRVWLVPLSDEPGHLPDGVAATELAQVDAAVREGARLIGTNEQILLRIPASIVPTEQDSTTRAAIVVGRPFDLPGVTADELQQWLPDHIVDRPHEVAAIQMDRMIRPLDALTSTLRQQGNVVAWRAIPGAAADTGDH